MIGSYESSLRDIAHRILWEADFFVNAGESGYAPGVRQLPGARIPHGRRHKAAGQHVPPGRGKRLNFSVQPQFDKRISKRAAGLLKKVRQLFF